MRLKVNLLIYLLLTMSVLLEGQQGFRKGYVVNNSQDTVFGFIKLKKDVTVSPACVFKPEKSAVPVIYSPNDIVSFRFNDGRYFIAEDIQTSEGIKKIFLEYLLKGTLRLFTYTDGNIKRYLIVDENNRIFTLSRNISGLLGKNGKSKNEESSNNKKILKTVMSDTPDLYSRIEKLSLDDWSITNLLHDYHNSVSGNENVITYREEPPVFSLKAGPLISYQNEPLIPKEGYLFSNFDWRNSNSISFGISSEASWPRSGDRFSLRLDLSLGRKYYYGYYKDDSTEHYITFNEAHLHNTYLESGLALQFKIKNTAQLRPYIYGGMFLRSLLSENARIDMSCYYDEGIFTVSETPISMKNRSLPGYFAGLGCETDYRDICKIYFRADIKELFAKKDYYNLRSINLTVGLKF